MIETWKCHSCGQERPDDKISVYTYMLKNLPGAERNWRYCNDNKECYEIALKKGKEESV